MDDETADYWFGEGLRDDLDAAIEVAKPFVYPTRAAMYEALAHACASAKRLSGTVYYAREHKFINELLDDIVGR